MRACYGVSQTIENTREKDETIVVADDEELEADTAEDEFAAHFNREQAPQILVTTSRKPSGAMFKFLENLFETLPNATYYARRDYEVKRIVEYAKGRGFTDLLVWNENTKFSKGANVNGLLAVHLPEGPSAHFKVSNVVLSKNIKARARVGVWGGGGARAVGTVELAEEAQRHLEQIGDEKRETLLSSSQIRRGTGAPRPTCPSSS